MRAFVKYPVEGKPALQFIEQRLGATAQERLKEIARERGTRQDNVHSLTTSPLSFQLLEISDVEDSKTNCMGMILDGYTMIVKIPLYSVCGVGFSSARPIQFVVLSSSVHITKGRCEVFKTRYVGQHRFEQFQTYSCFTCTYFR